MSNPAKLVFLLYIVNVIIVTIINYNGLNTDNTDAFEYRGIILVFIAFAVIYYSRQLLINHKNEIKNLTYIFFGINLFGYIIHWFNNGLSSQLNGILELIFLILFIIIAILINNVKLYQK